MNLAEILEIMNSVVTLGVGAMIGAGIAYLLMRFFVASYLTEKGKNLATVQDIAKITEQVEGVKAKYSEHLVNLSSQNAKLIEELRGKTQLRLAVAEKRLIAHQEAYVLWQKLISTVNSPEARSTVVECYNWWVKNCIFLGPASRAAFSAAYLAANVHESLLMDRSNPDAVSANFAKIRGAGDIIISEVELPPLGEAGLALVLEKGPG